jgi:hypothetical protein
VPRIQCSYLGCIYREGNFCRAEVVELDPQDGCLTFMPIEDMPLEDDDWDELFEEEEVFFEEEDDDDGYDPSEWN